MIYWKSFNESIRFLYDPNISHYSNINKMSNHFLIEFSGLCFILLYHMLWLALLPCILQGWSRAFGYDMFCYVMLCMLLTSYSVLKDSLWVNQIVTFISYESRFMTWKLSKEHRHLLRNIKNISKIVRKQNFDLNAVTEMVNMTFLMLPYRVVM